MSDSDPQPGDIFDEERILRLVDLMKEHGLSEIDLRQDEQQIRLSRGIAGPPQTQPLPPAMPAAAAQTPAPVPEEDPNVAIIKSPMVGTFYSRPNPNSDPYVKVGDHIDPETTVCIIEAMKVFNEIPAEVRGKVVATLVDDEEPVEFGKPLFKVDTSA